MFSDKVKCIGKPNNIKGQPKDILHQKDQENFLTAQWLKNTQWVYQINLLNSQ